LIEELREQAMDLHKRARTKLARAREVRKAGEPEMACVLVAEAQSEAMEATVLFNEAIARRRDRWLMR
jgi:hypothetical protein